MSERTEYIHAISSNAVAYRIVRSGGTDRDVIVGLCNELARCSACIAELESIAPRKAIINGKALAWHCPDALIPESRTLREETP